MADRTPVIAGIGLSDYPVTPELDSMQHHVLAMRRALDDSGVKKSDVDGYMQAGEITTMAEYLQVDHRYVNGTMTGGSSFEFHLQHAASAIKDGLADTILITYGSNMFSASGRTLGTRMFSGTNARVSGPLQFEAPYANVLVGAYAMAAQRHMYEYGTKPEQLAEIAVAVRKHATMNPNATYRDPITVEDVLASRLVADPLHKLDCCVVSDGGGALIVTTAERAKDLRQPPVYILGAGGAHTHWNISQMPDFTVTAGAKSGPIAFERAGVKPGDIDTIQFYDSFTITVLLLLEDVGFCKKGEGGAFVSDGKLGPGGALPLNTDGGGLSSCHPGMRGIFLPIEATRQLRGQAGDAQVAGAKLALCVGSGGWLSYIGAVVLGSEHP